MGIAIDSHSYLWYNTTKVIEGGLRRPTLFNRPHQYQRKEMTSVADTLTSSPVYIRNPDVVLREEDPDGGLLFNPDTNQIRVLNATGLLVWQLCDGRHAVPDIVAALKQAFDGAPEDQVTDDVQEFVQEMQASGFLGVMEAQAGR